jgi:hypothetical protein
VVSGDPSGLFGKVYRMADCSPAFDRRFWLIDDDFATCEDAFAAAVGFVGSRLLVDIIEPLTVIGEFVVPPADGPASRDFQTLHFDFGLPLVPRIAQDVARYTALYVNQSKVEVAAVTRLVPLASLLAQRDWPERADLIARFVTYGRTHGARDDREGYSEGSFARVIDAAAATRPLLTSVKTDRDFLCGMEFDTLSAELAFFQRHGLRIEDVEIDILVRPGQLFVFDNLAFAHGRRGQRQPGELHQRIFGHRRLSPADQLRVRERVLSAFYASSTNEATHGSPVSIP